MNSNDNAPIPGNGRGTETQPWSATANIDYWTMDSSALSIRSGLKEATTLFLSPTVPVAIFFR